MDSTQTTTVPANYLGLKTELQNIAGIIEQYPEHLKQRTFELLITAYLESNHSKESTPPQGQEAQALESAPAETVANTVEENAGENGFSVGTDEQEADTSASDLECQINAKIESSTNMLRRRIRLRTMRPMRWPVTA